MFVLKIFKLIKKPSSKKIPYNCFNIGSNKPQKLKYFLRLIESSLQKKAKIKFLSLQKGEVEKTQADISRLKKYIKFQPKTNLKDGIMNFIDWYKSYYNVHD